jgi:thiamine-phosphate pyrophosphorylase
MRSHSPGHRASWHTALVPVSPGDRRARLAAARVYLVCGAMPGGRELREVLPEAIAGGVDVVQLRQKDAAEQELLPVARQAAEICADRGALLIVNDWPKLAAEAGADGVHVGQDDIPPAQARAIVGPQMLVGLSTHAPHEIDAAAREPIDYIGVGPVHETPTKPGRPAVGTELVSYAAARAKAPFFAIGGLDEGNIGEVLAAGATRVCVLRAIAEAEDPGAAARALRERIDAAPSASA